MDCVTRGDNLLLGNLRNRYVWRFPEHKLAHPVLLQRIRQRRRGAEEQEEVRILPQKLGFVIGLEGCDRYHVLNPPLIIGFILVAVVDIRDSCVVIRVLAGLRSPNPVIIRIISMSVRIVVEGSDGAELVVSVAPVEVDDEFLPLVIVELEEDVPMVGLVSVFPLMGGITSHPHSEEHPVVFDVREVVAVTILIIVV